MQTASFPWSVPRFLVDKAWPYHTRQIKLATFGEKGISSIREISRKRPTSSLSILLSSTLLSEVGWQYESSMWTASVIQSCRSFIARENWLCSATTLSSLDTFSWKWQKSFSRWPFRRDLTVWSYSDCKTNPLLQASAIRPLFLRCTDTVCGVLIHEMWTISLTRKTKRITGAKSRMTTMTMYCPWIYLLFFFTTVVILFGISEISSQHLVWETHESSFCSHRIIFGSTDSTDWCNLHRSQL